MRREAGPFAVGIGVTGLGLFFLLGARSIAGEAPYAGVGPRAFPTLIGAGLTILGISFLVAARRGMVVPRGTAPVERDAVPWILAGLVGATALIESLGFPLATGLLFVLAARGFGSRRWLRNALLGVALGTAIYLGFSRALGVSLPGGPLSAW